MKVEDFSPIQKFQYAISGIGLFPPVTVLADGERKTYYSKLQKEKIEVWYVLNPDLQTGYFGVVGLKVRWDYANANAQLATKPRMA